MLPNNVGESLDSTTGTYVAQTTADVNYNGGLLNHWMGVGSFVLPGGALPLLPAGNVTHLHLHQHTPTLHPT